MIGAILKQMMGLFVDDELMAVAILTSVAVIAALTLIGGLPVRTAGLLLIVALPTALAASVRTTVQRARRSAGG